MPRAEPKVFLSFAKSDDLFVRRLRAALTEQVPGIQFFSEHQMTPGDDWADMLKRMIDSSDVVIVVVSAKTTSSSWTGFELGFALQSFKRIIPVLRGDPSKISPVLRTLTYIDFRDDKRFDELIGILASAILNRSEPQASDEETKDTGRRYVEAREEQLLLLQEHQTKITSSVLQEGVRRSLAGFIIVVMIALMLVALVVLFANNTSLRPLGNVLLGTLGTIFTSTVAYYFGRRSTERSSNKKAAQASDIAGRASDI